MRLLIAALALSICSCGNSSVSRPADAPAKVLGVELTGRVVDAADVLPLETERLLSSQLASLEADTSDQLVVVTLPRLKGHSIEDVGIALGRGWGIGRADIRNGVLLVVAPNERRVRIEVGYGLEGLLTDERAAQIVHAMLPQFRKGNIASGVALGVQEIDRLLRSDRRRPQYRSEEQKAA